MKKYILLFLFTLTVTYSLFSQSDFRPGYIIDNNRDTVNGLIDYKGNKASSRICHFKTNTNSGVMVYTPEEILAYRFTEGKYYVSRKVNTGDKEEFLFLEYLIDGIVDIFYYRDNNNENYLLDKGDGTLLNLKDNEKDVNLNGVTYRSSHKDFVGVLKYVFMKSDAVCNEVDAISLDRKSLIKVARDYHQEICTDQECIIFEKKMPLIHFTAGPEVALNINSIHIGKMAQTDLFDNETHFNTAVFPSAGCFAKVNLPSLDERLNLHFDIMLGKRNFSMISTYNGTLDTLTILTEKQEFSQLSLYNCLSVLYEFPAGAYRPSFHAGMFTGYYFQNDYAYHLIINNFEYKAKYRNVYPFTKTEYGLAVGAGIIHKTSNHTSLTLNLEFQFGTGIYSSYSSRNMLLKLGFQFGK